MGDALREAVCEANRELARLKLVTLTWGNTSGVDRARGFFYIKPSGVPYEELTPEHMVPIRLADGQAIETRWRPSSDTPTHWRLYQAFEDIGGITHTHSPFAVAFAQARRSIPCLGTTHADTFRGEIPLTRLLTESEVEEAYEDWTGRVIVERFQSLDVRATPGVLVAGHAPFTWGRDPMESVHHSLILEEVARMAWTTLMLRPDVSPLPDWISRKHYERKHGPKATYGQSGGKT
jgi:L-ribulose-5-phosphate 4-epimerase